MSTIFHPAALPGIETIEVEDGHALGTTRALMALGFPVGPSSGLNFCAAMEVLRRTGREDFKVVTVFPDRMERYFTTELFRPMREAMESAIETGNASR
jgi:cysteine synthase A